MNEPFFSRMSLVITNQCNQQCPYCFEGAWKDAPEQWMTLDNISRLLKWKNWEDGKIPTLFLLGGEPTVHPQLMDIIDLVNRFDSRINVSVLTNLKCDVSLLRELIARKVHLFVNVDQFHEKSRPSDLDVILSNLDFLNNISLAGFHYNISSTVDFPEKNFDYLYDIVRRGGEKIYNLRLSPCCPGYRFANNFQTTFDDTYFNTVLATLKKCLSINPFLHLSSECAVNGCMISPVLFDELTKMGYGMRYKCGIPEPNADILPDMSAHWCFAFEGIEEMSVTNVFDYPDYNSMIQELECKYQKFSERYQPVCKKKVCGNSECSGTCAALNYYFREVRAKFI